MRIVINHLTRMRGGNICVAGIETSTGRHIRPTLFGKLPSSLLAQHGGPFDMAAIVDLGPIVHEGKAPEMEDHRFQQQAARNLGFLPPADYWQLLQHVAHPKLADIFGVELKQHGAACVVDVGTGPASLGCLIPFVPPLLSVRTFEVGPKIRAHVSDGVFDCHLSVTDLRLVEADYQTPRSALITQLNRRIQNGARVILSVGLGRKWKKPGDTVERHWLQVNNLHLEDDPAWRLS